MKTKLLTYYVCAALLTGTAAFSQIPNNGFENWANVPFQYQNPVNWNTNNSDLDANNLVSPTTTSYQGTKAMKVLNYYNNVYQARCGGNANTKFYYTQRPVALNGYYKVDLQPGDTATIEVVFTLGTAVIGGGVQYFTVSTSNYSSFSVPINFTNGSNPDSAYISITTGQIGLNFVPQVPDDSLLIDELVFDISSGMTDGFTANNFRLHPNPVSDKLNIDLPIVGWEGTIQVLNVWGQTIHTERITDKKSIQLEIQHIASGLYMIQFTDINGRTVTNRFVKE